jgi:glucose dehydrogenase
VTKLADRSTPGVFLSYEPRTKGYRVYDPVKDRLMVTRDVIFNEKKAWNWERGDSKQSSEAAIPNIFTV